MTLRLWALAASVSLILVSACGDDTSTPADSGIPGADATVDAGATDSGTDACAAAPCKNGGTCRSEAGGFVCACPPAFTGTTCEDDVDECAVPALNPCDVNAACTNEPGSASCACRPGYVGDGHTCAVDPDCSHPGVTCGTNASCVENLGVSRCACDDGYTGDGQTCTDTDGCAGSPCFRGVDCTDVPAPGTGFTCDDCPTGFAGDGVQCTDIDGCATDPCFAGVTCTDVPAPGTGFTCDECPPGFTGDGIQCARIDARSCLDLLRQAPGIPDGVYTIDSDGSGARAPFEVYCDMTVDGGGWTMVGRSAPGAADGGNFGWRSARGAPTDDTQPYSLNVVANGVDDFTEILLGSYTAGKQWGANAYKLRVKRGFVADHENTSYRVGPRAAQAVIGACDGPAMLQRVGYTANDTSFHLRDIDGNGHGLLADVFSTFYDDCELGGSLRGQPGMIFVRDAIVERSCADLPRRVTASGVYAVDPDGPAGSMRTWGMYCDLESEDGGWSLLMSTGGVGPESLTAGPTTATVTGYLPASLAVALAEQSNQIHIRTTGDLSRSVTSRPGTQPILNLRAGVLLNADPYSLDDWEGPRATFEFLGIRCQQANTYPNLYQTCGGGGMHLLGSASSWVYPVVNEAMQVYVRRVDPRPSCLAHLEAGYSASGTYPIDPDGPGGLEAFNVYCDQVTDGGGWALIGKTAAGDYTALTDDQFRDLVLNPVDHVNAQLLLTPTQPSAGEIAFYDRARTNALYVGTAKKQVRVILSDNLGNPATNGRYFQEKLTSPETLELWAALRDARLWGSGTDGVLVTNFGVDFKLSFGDSAYDAATHSFAHTGDGTYGWWNANTFTLKDGSMFSASRHMGMLGDGIGDEGQQWLITVDPTDPRWKNDNATQTRATLWLK